VDFGLTVIAELKGQEAAELTQLALEYEPQPPFNSGHPRSATQAAIAGVKAMMAHMIQPGVDLATAYRQRIAASSSTPATA
jgi:cyclohexyl-isocyanide hydratase